MSQIRPTVWETSIVSDICSNQMHTRDTDERLRGKEKKKGEKLEMFYWFATFHRFNESQDNSGQPHIHHHMHYSIPHPPPHVHLSIGVSWTFYQRIFEGLLRFFVLRSFVKSDSISLWTCWHAWIDSSESSRSVQIAVRHRWEFEHLANFPNDNIKFSQETIETHTLPHKYKKLRRASEADEDSEKCTICLSQFEIDNDVR